jgi:hypothetical protein
VVENGRGSGALRKLGAVAERFLSSALVVGDTTFDQVLWAIAPDASSSRMTAASRREIVH